MGNFAAFLDASVLYPAPLRDLLMELAVSDLDRAKWSDAVHEEWIRAVLQKRSDLTRAQIERTRDLMNVYARDALVTDFEQLIDVLELPDPDDRHVLAAAIKGRADLIVTANLKDFPAEKLDRWRAVIVRMPISIRKHDGRKRSGSTAPASQRCPSAAISTTP